MSQQESLIRDGLSTLNHARSGASLKLSGTAKSLLQKTLSAKLVRAESQRMLHEAPPQRSHREINRAGLYKQTASLSSAMLLDRSLMRGHNQQQQWECMPLKEMPDSKAEQAQQQHRRKV